MSEAGRKRTGFSRALGDSLEFVAEHGTVQALGVKTQSRQFVTKIPFVQGGGRGGRALRVALSGTGPEPLGVFGTPATAARKPRTAQAESRVPVAFFGSRGAC